MLSSGLVMASGASSGGFGKSEEIDIEIPEEVETVLEELLKGLQDRVSPKYTVVILYTKIP